jgi:two-component system copper resistance phosphate regulon response regulator CusR
VRILVAEDEKKVAAFIANGFSQEGYAVDVAHDGEDALFKATTIDYDAAILDWMLPKQSGLEVLRAIRAKRLTLPVLILTAKGSLEDRVLGLDSGADDYVVKPFAFAELSARIRSLLRRGKPEESILRIADLEMNTVTRRVQRNGREIDLKPKEYAVLDYLLRHARRPVTRTMIIEHVWDLHFDSVSNIVDVHINSLRNKLDRGADVPLIHTIRGVGYVLSDKQP